MNIFIGKYQFLISFNKTFVVVFKAENFLFSFIFYDQNIYILCFFEYYKKNLIEKIFRYVFFFFLRANFQYFLWNTSEFIYTIVKTANKKQK